MLNFGLLAHQMAEPSSNVKDAKSARKSQPSQGSNPKPKPQG